MQGPKIQAGPMQSGGDMHSLDSLLFKTQLARFVLCIGRRVLTYMRPLATIQLMATASSKDTKELAANINVPKKGSANRAA